MTENAERPTLGLVRRVFDFPNAEVWVHCPDCRVVAEIVTTEYSTFRVDFCGRHAAAPDLLAALELAKRMLYAWHQIGMGDDAAWLIYNDESPEMKQINAAITKAATPSTLGRAPADADRP